MLHQAHQPPAARLIRRLTVPALAACLLAASAALGARPAGAQGGAGAQPQQPAQRPRTKRVTPLRKSESAQGSRVTITSDGGALSDYSAYRSGDRFIVVIPQAEAVGGGGGVSGRGLQGAQVTKRGNDLVYTFKLEPGATARVNQRFNQLDVQVTASKQAGAANAQTPSATPAPTPRPTRTPAELSGLPSPTPDPVRADRANANAQTSAVVPPGGVIGLAPGATEIPTASPASTPTPDATPSVSPTPEQIAQVLPTPAAPVSAPATTTAPAQGRTLGAAVVSNWPWLLAALLAVGVALLFVGRLGSRGGREAAPPASAATAPPPAPAEKATAKPLRGAVTAPPAAKVTPAAPAANVAPAAPAATPVPVVLPVETKKETAEAAKQRKQTKAERRKEKKQKEAAGRVAAIEARQAAGKIADDADAGEARPTATAGAAEVEAAPAADAEAGALAGAVVTTAAAAPEAPAPAPAHAEEKGIVLGAADAERVGAEVHNLLAGESYDQTVVGAHDSATRQLVAAELSAALAGRNSERIGRARAAFLKHGYFDDAARDLQTAEAPGQRAAAALSLALLLDRAATPHLVSALEDPSPDVRRASVEALSQLKDPAACAPLEALRWRERSRQVPQSLIRHAIEACTPEEADAEDTLVADEETIIRESAAAPAAAPVETTPAEVAAADETASGGVDEAVRAQVPASEIRHDEPTASVFGFEPQPIDSAAYASPVIESEDFAPSAFASATAEAETSEPSAYVPRAAGVLAPEPGSAEVTATELSAVETHAEIPASELEPASLISEDAAAAEAAPANAAEVVYTFDQSEAAESGRADARAEEEVYAAPEFAVSHEAEGPAGEELIEVEGARVSEPEAPHAGPETATADATADEVSAGWAGAEADAEPPDYRAFSYHAETLREAGGAATDEGEEIEIAPEEKGVEFGAEERIAELAEEEKGIELLIEEKGIELTSDAAAGSPRHAGGSAPSFEPEVETESPLEFAGVEPFAVAPAEEQAAARGLASADESPAEVRAGERGLAAPGGDAEELSIIPKAIQLKLDSDDASERAESVLALARLNTDQAYTQICEAFDDRDSRVRDAAARALYEVADDRAESFTRALREAGPERRRHIGAALSSSGLAEEAIGQLTGESRDKTYDAFSLLFLMAKAGETAPLIHAIESHPDTEVRLAVVKLLALSGQQEVLPSFRRLAVRGSLPTEVRSAVMEAIYQISSGPAATNRAN